jgi:PfaB family protein
VKVHPTTFSPERKGDGSSLTPLDKGGQGGILYSASAALQSLSGTALDLGALVTGPALETGRLREQISGPWLDYAGYREPLPAMLVQAHEWLEAGEVQAVLIAGCSLVETEAAGDPGFGFDQSIHRSYPVSGATAVVVMRLADAQRRKLKVLAIIDELAYQTRTAPVVLSDTIRACAQTVQQAQGVKPEEIGYLEALASGEDGLDEIEIRGLAAAYPGQSLQTALGSARAESGWLEGINGLASLARAAACIAERLRPGVTAWSGPKFPALWPGSTFYVPAESLYWFRPPAPGKRRAAVNLLGKDGSCGHLLLSGSGESAPPQTVMRVSDWSMFTLGGADLAAITAGLETLKADLEQGKPLPELARDAYERLKTIPPAMTVAILGRNPAEVARECDFALRGVPSAAEKGSDWQTPLGSYYTPSPLGGPHGKVAFVYPGAFNSYLGAGKDLFNLFPGLEERFQGAVAENVGAVLYEDRLYPRSLAPLTKEQLDALEAALLTDAFAMMSSGLTLSVALTTIFRDIFKLKPDCAFGYSLGENSMLFAMGVWGDGDGLGARLSHSPLFKTRLAGPQNAVREYWGLPPQESGAISEKEALWNSFILMAPPEKVREALATETRVYLTHVNTPRQVVIAGDPAACRGVIERLKCSSLRAPFNDVLHCKAMESEYQALYDLHLWPVRQASPVPLYSAADDRPFEMSETGIARAVARDQCSMLDFSRLVETAYADGARIFVELGAGSNCAKWIEDNLRGRPFLAVSANRKGVEDASAILRVLARLVSHKVAVDLAPLYSV